MSCMYSFAGELWWTGGKEKAGSELCLQGFQVNVVDPEDGVSQASRKRWMELRKFWKRSEGTLGLVAGTGPTQRGS